MGKSKKRVKKTKKAVLIEKDYLYLHNNRITVR